MNSVLGQQGPVLGGVLHTVMKAVGRATLCGAPERSEDGGCEQSGGLFLRRPGRVFITHTHTHRSGATPTLQSNSCCGPVWAGLSSVVWQFHSGVMPLRSNACSSCKTPSPTLASHDAVWESTVSQWLHIRVLNAWGTRTHTGNTHTLTHTRIHASHTHTTIN